LWGDFVTEHQQQPWLEWEGVVTEVQPGWREEIVHEDAAAVSYRQFHVQIAVVEIA